MLVNDGVFMNVRDGYCYTDYFELVKLLGEISIKKISFHGETHISNQIHFNLRS